MDSCGGRRPTAARGGRKRALRMLLAAYLAQAQADDQLCDLPAKNTLSTTCFGVCSSAPGFPLCVNYAPATAQANSSQAGDGNYYYLGCDFPGMDTCITNVTANQCELQCLQTTNTEELAWTLNVAQPQADKSNTALFQIVDSLDLPPTLKNLSIIGATGSSRYVPMSFSNTAFWSGSALERIEITDVSIGNITVNIFPDGLDTLIVKRAQLDTFDPRGDKTFTSVSYLDLAENELTDIPGIIYELGNLSSLYLQGNSISDAHVTLAQWQFLESLTMFEANLTVNDTCAAGYIQKSWDEKSICVLASDGLTDISGSGVEDGSSSGGGIKTSSALLIILLLSAVAIIAAIGGVFLLKRRVKQKADSANQQSDSARGSGGKLASSGGKFTSSMRNLLGARFGSSGTKLEATAIEESYYEHGASTSEVIRKTACKDIPTEHVTVLMFMTKNGDVHVSKAEYLTRLVLLHQLKISDDVGENSETAHHMVPIISQLRHPQLLSVLGLMWDEVHTISAVCEHMNLGTLEGFLHSSSHELTWSNFKMKAASQVARGLMYLHSQRNVVYDGLNGKSVFVDTEKGCKLNTVLAAIPSELEPRESMYEVDSRRSLRRFDSSAKAFFAPEILAGDAPRASSDMYAFGVLLAHLDTTETADEMIRSSWRLRTTQLDTQSSSKSLLEADSSRGSSTRKGINSLMSTGSSFRGDLDSSRRETTKVDDLRSTSLMTMFTFTDECPAIVRELATACLQYDPSLRPSASYIAAMLHY